MKFASQDNIDTLRRVFFNKTAYIVYVVVAACALFYVVQTSRVEARLESEINQIAEVAGLSEVVRPFETNGPAICSSSCLSGSKRFEQNKTPDEIVSSLITNYSHEDRSDSSNNLLEATILLNSSDLSYTYTLNIFKDNTVGIGASTTHGIFDL